MWCFVFLYCNTIAQLLVLVGGKMHSLQVSGELISKMAGSCPPTENGLLRAEMASLSFNQDTKEILNIVLK